MRKFDPFDHIQEYTLYIPEVMYPMAKYSLCVCTSKCSITNMAYIICRYSSCAYNFLGFVTSGLMFGLMRDTFQAAG